MFFHSNTNLKQLLESTTDVLIFNFASQPKLLRAFKVFITFSSNTHPNKAGAHWHASKHPTPLYFSNSGPCHKDASRDLISRRLFPFLRRIIADHLYSCGYGLKLEQHSGEVFKSCRGTQLYQETTNVGQGHPIYKGPKYLGTEYEVYPGHCRE